MPLIQSWTDVYGTVLAHYQGRAGGHRWLVAAPPDVAGPVADELTRLPSYKGELLLLVYGGLTPLAAAARAQHDPVLGRGLRGVLVVQGGLAGPLASGGPVSLPPQLVADAATGLSYQDGGDYPGWQDALGQGEGVAGVPAAGVIAGLGLPVRVCGPAGLHQTLNAWWQVTPHAL